MTLRQSFDSIHEALRVCLPCGKVIEASDEVAEDDVRQRQRHSSCNGRNGGDSVQHPRRTVSIAKHTLLAESDQHLLAGSVRGTHSIALESSRRLLLLSVIRIILDTFLGRLHGSSKCRKRRRCIFWSHLVALKAEAPCRYGCSPTFGARCHSATRGGEVRESMRIMTLMTSITSQIDLGSR